MIYCTMSIGKYHSEKYSNDINRLATKYKVEVLTDCPEYFKNCTIHEYSRDVFSYYEKLPFMLSVILNNKDRVLYFDSDTINEIENSQYNFDEKSVYTYKLYPTSTYFIKYGREKALEILTKDSGIIVLLDILDELGYDMCDYLHERILSIPYSNKIKKVKEEILELQNIFEEKHPKNKDWSEASRKDLQRYSKAGCGYGEGGALSIVLTNHKFKFKELNQKIPI